MSRTYTGGNLWKDDGAEDAHIGIWAIILVDGHVLNVVNDVEALCYFAKDGVLSVQMGRAAHGLVGLYHLGRDDGLALCEGVKTFLYATYLCVGEGSPPYDVELACP